MRIGFDATAMPARPVGAGNYILQLVRNLIALHPDEEWFIFTHPADHALFALPPELERFLIDVPDLSPSRRLIWEQMALPGLCRRLRLDLLHSPHYTMPVAAPCPVVVTIHDMTMFLYPELHVPAKRIFFPLMIRWSARHAAQLLSVSASTRDDFCRILSVPNERVMITPLGVSPDFFPPVSVDKRAEIAARYQLPEQYILYVGLIEPRKNVPLLLEAYAHLCQQRDVSHQLVIGGRMGWASSEILPLVEQLGIKERVIFTGYIDQEDVPGVFQMADIFVYPSIYEGFGFPVLEGLASGVPVITTRVSSMPEVAGDAAILIPPNDSAALTTAMDKLLSEPQLAVQLRAAGPLQAQSYTWERTARLTWEAYQSIRRGNHV